MLQNPRQKHALSGLVDTPASYGWISIAIHWLTAVAIIALWFLGQRIESADSVEVDARRALHISIATSLWLLVLFRIGWRFRSGHPRVRGLTRRMHSIAKGAHYMMLALLLLMLASGPVMVWSGGGAVMIFDLVSVPAPFGEVGWLADVAHTIHSASARALLLLVLLHIAGALKHLMFHADDTIVRMLWPGPSEERQ